MTHEAGRFEEADLFSALQARYENWLFAEHDDSENFAFAHGMAAATLDSFPYLDLAGSGRFTGEETPDSLKPLVSYVSDFQGGTMLYDQSLAVRLTRRRDNTRIEAELPHLSEMLEDGKTFREIVGAYMLNSELLEGMRPAQVIKDEAIVVRFGDGLQRGLEFISLPDRIEIGVYGEAGKTRSFSNYLVTYHDKPRVLAETTAGLAVLGAKHCQRMNNPNSPDYYVKLSESSRRFLKGLL